MDDNTLLLWCDVTYYSLTIVTVASYCLIAARRLDSATQTEATLTALVTFVLLSTIAITTDGYFNDWDWVRRGDDVPLVVIAIALPNLLLVGLPWILVRLGALGKLSWKANSLLGFCAAMMALAYLPYLFLLSVVTITGDGP